MPEQFPKYRVPTEELRKLAKEAETWGKKEETLEIAEKATKETEQKLNQRAEEFGFKPGFKLETPQSLEWLTEKHIEALKQVFGPNNLEISALPRPEDLKEDTDFVKMMYPEQQRDQDTKRGLVSFRPSWWNKKIKEYIPGIDSDETCGQCYLHSMRGELKHFQGSLILIETIQKPHYTAGTQHYGTKQGNKPDLDPLLPLFQEVFGKKANRFIHSHKDLTEKLLPKAKERILKQFQDQGLKVKPEEIDVILCPASLFNLQTTLFHPENSSTDTWEWASTFLLDKNNQDTGRALGVGYSVYGGASSAADASRDITWDDGGGRLAIVFPVPERSSVQSRPKS